MFIPHNPTAAIITVGERRRELAGPEPEPNISPTSCPADIVYGCIQGCVAAEVIEVNFMHLTFDCKIKMTIPG